MNRRDFLTLSGALLDPFAARPRLLHAQPFYPKQMENGTIHAADPSGGKGLPDLEPLSHGVIMGRPTDTSVMAHIMADEDMDCFLEYGTDSDEFAHQTETLSILAGFKLRAFILSFSVVNPCEAKSMYLSLRSGHITNDMKENQDYLATADSD